MSPLLRQAYLALAFAIFALMFSLFGLAVQLSAYGILPYWILDDTRAIWWRLFE